MAAELKKAPEAYEIHDHAHQTQVLGVDWFPLQDVFNFTISGDGTFLAVKTKRQMLSDIANLYDPLGWLSASSFVSRAWFSESGWQAWHGTMIFLTTFWSCGYPLVLIFPTSQDAIYPGVCSYLIKQEQQWNLMFSVALLK